MCQYLPSTSIKLIKRNKSFKVMITYLHIFKFHISSKFCFCQNNRSEIAVAVNLLRPVVPGIPKRVKIDTRYKIQKLYF